ncbi:MAG: hypothetical protein E6767_08000 [Dysgonomonas sp.]|nr:hypothetical protein [Dysgonomonas sp.]
MRYYSLPVLLILILFACCGNKKVESVAVEEISLSVMNSVIEQEESKEKSDVIPMKEGRKLRYLFSSNGGLVGYFDDGTVAACPRCDLLDVNVEALYRSDVWRTYIIESDGALLIDGEMKEYPVIMEERGYQEWVMIDYKWIVEPEIYKE